MLVEVRRNLISGGSGGLVSQWVRDRFKAERGMGGKGPPFRLLLAAPLRFSDTHRPQGSC